MPQELAMWGRSSASMAALVLILAAVFCVTADGALVSRNITAEAYVNEMDGTSLGFATEILTSAQAGQNYPFNMCTWQDSSLRVAGLGCPERCPGAAASSLISPRTTPLAPASCVWVLLSSCMHWQQLSTFARAWELPLRADKSTASVPVHVRLCRGRSAGELACVRKQHAFLVP